MNKINDLTQNYSQYHIHLSTFQGMSRDIIDAAVMQQFKEYLVKKGAYLLDNGVSDASSQFSIN